MKDAACDVLLQARVDRRRAAAGGSRLRDKLTRLGGHARGRGATEARISDGFADGRRRGSRAEHPRVRLSGAKGEEIGETRGSEPRRTPIDWSSPLWKRETAATALLQMRLNKPNTRPSKRGRLRETRRRREPRPRDRRERRNGNACGPEEALAYSGETSREYIGQLRCDEFATDIQPEIMDGKNVPRQRLFRPFPNFKLRRRRRHETTPPRRRRCGGFATRRDRV